MAHPEWKIHGGETLAAYLPETELRGILEKRIAVPPDHAALLIRDGALVDALIGAQFSVGGLWQSLKGLIGGPHALRLLVADLKPFPVLVPLEGFTMDHVEIEAELAFELQLNPEKPTDIMGLVRDGRSVTRTDVFERVRPHLQERVLFHELVQHDAEHLRANRLYDRLICLVLPRQVMGEIPSTRPESSLMYVKCLCDGNVFLNFTQHSHACFDPMLNMLKPLRGDRSSRYNALYRRNCICNLL